MFCINIKFCSAPDPPSSSHQKTIVFFSTANNSSVPCTSLHDSLDASDGRDPLLVADPGHTEGMKRLLLFFGECTQPHQASVSLGNCATELTFKNSFPTLGPCLERVKGLKTKIFAPQHHPLHSPPPWQLPNISLVRARPQPKTWLRPCAILHFRGLPFSLVWLSHLNMRNY